MVVSVREGKPEGRMALEVDASLHSVVGRGPCSKGVNGVKIRGKLESKRPMQIFGGRMVREELQASRTWVP